MDTTRGKDRRGQFLIDPRISRQALAVACFHLIAVGICIGLPLFAMTRSLDAILLGQSAVMVALFERWETYIFVALAVYVLVATTGWLLAGLRRDHRTAGPIIRMTRFAHDLAAGNFSTRIGLRARDELQALGEALNVLAEGLEQRDKALLQEISDRVEKLRRAPHQPQSDPSPSDAPVDVIALVDSAFETATSAPREPSFPHPN